ncbi:uncharacterized protein LAESUDRAFT_45053 [Laetiporus sulphureus 93-53]|uniref:Uncharacterized protein n=1 Tax=Laetiporus sulphureus 93-53 TaxID=1314785 RepID=A0A165F906_9APHY|nr:uncharacterized protein LAESUDRAFT_45053 [Laetiporus sulphureus 93-53]KZT08614.1 hypothetical protein LAESUDRAFT_45053 [Laetiporus sulphureus 93-53]
MPPSTYTVRVIILRICSLSTASVDHSLVTVGTVALVGQVLYIVLYLAIYGIFFSKTCSHATHLIEATEQPNNHYSLPTVMRLFFKLRSRRCVYAWRLLLAGQTMMLSHHAPTFRLVMMKAAMRRWQTAARIGSYAAN